MDTTAQYHETRKKAAAAVRKLKNNGWNVTPPVPTVPGTRTDSEGRIYTTRAGYIVRATKH